MNTLLSIDPPTAISPDTGLMERLEGSYCVEQDPTFLPSSKISNFTAQGKEYQLIFLD